MVNGKLTYYGSIVATLATVGTLTVTGTSDFTGLLTATTIKTNQIRAAYINDYTDAITAMAIANTTGEVTFGAYIKLANAFVGGAPAATGYVRIKDSTGTIYKLLCAP